MKTWNISQDCQLRLLFGARCNVYLLSCNNRHLLVDSSMKGERRFIVNRLHQLGIDHLDYLIFTHTHFDHAGNAAFLKRLFAPAVLVHRAEADYMRKGDTPLPQGTNAYTRFLIRLHKKHEIPDFSYEPCEVDIEMEDRLDLTDAGFPVTILHTPGHSAGSVSLIIDNRIALVGDTMFGQIPGVVFPVFADDEQALLKSWEGLLKTPCELFLPGHGKSIPRKKIENYLQKSTP